MSYKKIDHKAECGNTSWSLFNKDESEVTHDELRCIESTRRKLLDDSKSFTRLQIMTTFAGTVMPDLMCSRQAWSTFLLYVVLRILLENKVLEVGVDLPVLNTAMISVVGGFMSFFLVFYLSQTYSRFMQQYDISKRMEGRIAHLSYLAKVALPPAEAWRLIRYANAVHVLGYCGLSEAYTDANLFTPLNEKHKILTNTEVTRIRKIGMNKGQAAYQEVAGWCIDLIYDAFRKSHDMKHHHDLYVNEFCQDEKPAVALSSSAVINNNKINQSRIDKNKSNNSNNIYRIDISTMQHIIEELFTLRNSLGALFSYSDQSFPFSYIHLTIIICSIYLPLFAYATATYLPVHENSIFPNVLGAFIVMINIVFVIGVREIGKQMMDPYGNDLQDLSVLFYLENGLTASRRIFCGYRFTSPGLSVEEAMEEGRPKRPIGFRAKPPLKYSLINEKTVVIVNKHSPESNEEKVVFEEMEEDFELLPEGFEHEHDGDATYQDDARGGVDNYMNSMTTVLNPIFLS